MTKRGRKAKGVTTVPFYRRLTPEQVERVDEFIRSLKGVSLSARPVSETTPAPTKPEKPKEKVEVAPEVEEPPKSKDIGFHAVIKTPSQANDLLAARSQLMGRGNFLK